LCERCWSQIHERPFELETRVATQTSASLVVLLPAQPAAFQQPGFNRLRSDIFSSWHGHLASSLPTLAQRIAVEAHNGESLETSHYTLWEKVPGHPRSPSLGTRKRAATEALRLTHTSPFLRLALRIFRRRLYSHSRAAPACLFGAADHMDDDTSSRYRFPQSTKRPHAGCGGGVRIAVRNDKVGLRDGRG